MVAARYLDYVSAAAIPRIGHKIQTEQVEIVTVKDIQVPVQTCRMRAVSGLNYDRRLPRWFAEKTTLALDSSWCLCAETGPLTSPIKAFIRKCLN